MQPESRSHVQPVELRAAAEGSKSIGTIGGLAAVYRMYSRNLGGFVEQFEPGAFAKNIGDAVRVMARYNHDNAWLLGVTDSGTLRLNDSDEGFAYDVDLPDTEAGRAVARLTERGDVRGSSIMFVVPNGGDEWSYTDQGYPLRSVRSARLIDVGPVNDPAYWDTTASLRSLADARGMSIDEVREAADANQLRELIEPRLIVPSSDGLEIGGQGATHPPVSLRQREAAWKSRASTSR